MRKITIIAALLLLSGCYSESRYPPTLLHLENPVPYPTPVQTWPVYRPQSSVVCVENLGIITCTNQ